ncbi:unnamed protein product (macronuclear) [Paramecium tetraurelia]|uniref:MORN repeat protein n=1 Tax=Paramecium tetraurelia TaxID=5888 RepID=A0E0L7_PARTE|nr:uncharacterized protein GSPATT00022002001 [Paramecium tetraurelia]CAK88834.1 unnamed protein product [Paramecium tetraurelia]|eukprot:XP_001456231.1 hypothetical protein (macronuclear) [Paramecium tetraurelia strain d4-2]
MYRQTYQYPSRAYPQQVFGYLQPQYQHQVPQLYPQTIYQPYYGIQIPAAPKYPQPSIANQNLQSPQKNFQSPSRGFVSPSRTNLMQSQQNSQSQQNPILQSPSRTGYYTYEQVMEKIKNAHSYQQQQQNQQCIPQSRQQQENNYVESNQQKQVPNQQLMPKQGLVDNKQNIGKEIKKFEPKQTQEDKIKPEQKQQNDEELEELALQYEDGYIYRGQGYPPQTRQGFGMLTDNEGREVYAGYWKQNVYDGQGRLQNLQVEEIDGAFDCNNMTTIGNGWSSYEGQFVGGKMQGQGMIVLSNGEKYVGQFDDGMIHGDGEFTTYQNEVIKGNWDQGYLVQMTEE